MEMRESQGACVDHRWVETAWARERLAIAIGSRTIVRRANKGNGKAPPFLEERGDQARREQPQRVLDNKPTC
jgi:hypothetical protein